MPQDIFHGVETVEAPPRYEHFRTRMVRGDDALKVMARLLDFIAEFVDFWMSDRGPSIIVRLPRIGQFRPEKPAASVLARDLKQLIDTRFEGGLVRIRNQFGEDHYWREDLRVRLAEVLASQSRRKKRKVGPYRTRK